MLVTPEKSNLLKTQATRDFPGGSVVKNLPSNAGDVAMILVQKLRSHMLQGN